MPSSGEWVLPLAPDFMVENCAPAMIVSKTAGQMDRYRDSNGVRLGWLIDPQSKCAVQTSRDKECATHLPLCQGKTCYQEFVLDLGPIFCALTSS